MSGLQIKHGQFIEDVVSPAASQNNAISQAASVKINGRYYYNSIVGITSTDQVPSGCNEMTFLNAGASTVWINGVLPLYPGTVGSILGDSVTFDGKDGETDATIYQITFTGAGINNCIVFRKNYQ